MGSVTFSSTLAHASDDGTVTASVLIEIFNASLSKEYHPTITFYGQELAINVPVDDDDNSFGTMVLFIGGIASAVVVSVVVCIIVCG